MNYATASSAPPAGDTCPVRPGRPEILAPAGDLRAALAAFAAGADAVYLGLKHFSARMEAENFSTSTLSGLLETAKSEGRRVYVALNTLIRPDESAKLFRLIRRLCGSAPPAALIFQDTSLPSLAREAGFTGQLHLSTLGNATHGAALTAARRLGADRVILPRELTFEEVRSLNAACPQDLDLEIFVHGALCFCVSGRCWWSSYMGGRSGLRGRCVQPCRRAYAQKGRAGHFFSSPDLSLDVRVRDLLPLERLKAWKIEGRKKGPHYVYHVVKAYRLLRDEGDNAEARREAESLLAAAPGRPVSRALFAGTDAALRAPGDRQTTSGLFCGTIRTTPEGRSEFVPRLDLMPGDNLRIGSDDEARRRTLPVHAACAAGTPFAVNLRDAPGLYPVRAGKGHGVRAGLTEAPGPGAQRAGRGHVFPRGSGPPSGTPVYIIDRRGPALEQEIAAWSERLRRQLPKARKGDTAGDAEPQRPTPCKRGGHVTDMILRSSVPRGREAGKSDGPGTRRALWLSPGVLRLVSRTLCPRIVWWLPPVVWPDEEDLWQGLVRRIVRDGARSLVLNSPWQIELVPQGKNLDLTAGPFCNAANARALEALRTLGFTGAVAAPELGREDLLALPSGSPLPLGIVLSGFWPVGMSRFGAAGLNGRETFRGPKGEDFFLRRYGENLWIYPAWPLNLHDKRAELERAGYAFFIRMEESVPRGVNAAARPGEFNWNIGLL
ncbi:MAG: U32 family peptidase [Desulfovibrio sp.]|jgi:putative protease|nr:U32 family peptidase [Desulfovibrio sp.]